MFPEPVGCMWRAAALRKLKQIGPPRWASPLSQLAQPKVSCPISPMNNPLKIFEHLPMAFDSKAAVCSFLLPNISSILRSISSSLGVDSICSICEETLISMSMASLCSSHLFNNSSYLTSKVFQFNKFAKGLFKQRSSANNKLKTLRRWKNALGRFFESSLYFLKVVYTHQSKTVTDPCKYTLTLLVAGQVYSWIAVEPDPASRWYTPRMQEAACS